MDALLIGLLVGMLVVAGSMTLIAFRENRLRHAAEFRARCAEGWLSEKVREEEARDRTKSVGRRELAQMRSILDRPR